MTDTATGDGLRARKKRATRRALHRAAVDLVAERGLSGVTIDEIAAAAGVSPRTFFNYFPTKDAAVVGIGARLPDLVAEALRGRPPAEGVLDALRAVLSDALGLAVRDDDLRARRRDVIARHPELATTTLGMTLRVEEALARAVAARTGTDPDVDLYPRLVAACAAGAVRAAALHATRQDGPDRPATAHAALAALQDAFDLIAAGLPEPAGGPLSRRNR